MSDIFNSKLSLYYTDIYIYIYIERESICKGLWTINKGTHGLTEH